jgi:NAD(P)H-dependent FMN reductase
MITIISGTNRENSKSIEVARMYKDLLLHAGEKEVEILDLRDLPRDFLFSALYDNCGKDDEFNKLIRNFKHSKKYVFVVPEYNFSIPGALKAFLDGLPYPSPVTNKTAALIGLGSGTLGGAIALSHLTDILNYLGMSVLPNKPRLPKIESLLKNGQVNDSFIRQLIETQVRELVKV